MYIYTPKNTVLLNPKPYTLPHTPNPKPQTLNPKPQIPNPKPFNFFVAPVSL